MNNNEYLLKHCDTDVLLFTIDMKSMLVSGVKVLDEIFSPININGNEIVLAGNLNFWLSSRCIPNSREGAERLKSIYKINEIKEIMFLQMGLSLSDHYWIDKKPYNNKWKDINLFENRYDEELGKALFDRNFRLVKTVNEYGFNNPDVTTGGSLKKYWRYNKTENKSYLIKGGSGEHKQEPFNEYFAHLLLEELDYKHTPYFLENINGEYASICPCISDINNEMISAVDIVNKYGINKNYESFIKIGKEQGCIEFEDEVNKMIVLDFLIDNIDRHWYNFGIMRNSKTGTWNGLIPIFDNGYSLWNRDEVNSKIISESMSFADSNEQCIKLIYINKYLKKLPDMLGIFDKAFECYEHKERKKLIRNGIQERINDNSFESIIK